MSQVVIDSGILIASTFLETLTPQAQFLLKQLRKADAELHAPNLFRYEVIAVTRKAVYQERITAEEAKRLVDYLLSYPVTLHFDVSLLRRGYELATKYNRPTAYDSQYLALAERLSCDFWTADKKLFNAVEKHLPNVRWLGDVDLTLGL